jgi:hypothetical protein
MLNAVVPHRQDASSTFEAQPSLGIFPETALGTAGLQDQSGRCSATNQAPRIAEKGWGQVVSSP